MSGLKVCGGRVGRGSLIGSALNRHIHLATNFLVWRPLHVD